ncbi:FecCD family ABC transporter permease [Paenibacillus thermotolerans]|uniref:FecCD family ABC transporter permease n=1 Tax=Paenibacillus thermotolerans TaxID=3027807 RepID=UPI002368360D|nr:MULTISPECIES: iron ABC transporter permease [unclassified Paenibacillus]
MKKSYTLLIFCVLALVLAFLSLTYGSRSISWNAAFHSFTSFDPSLSEHLIIRNIRLPRMLVAASVGACLATAGAVMQTITRNPLASPGIFGVNAGAVLSIIVAISLFNISSLQQYTAAAFIGAAVAAVAAYGLGTMGRDGASPIKITLAGAAVTAFASSITQGILLVNGRTFDQVLFWLVGSVAGREMPMLTPVVPYMAAGVALALALARPLNILALGEDVARGLGQRTGLLKLGAAVAVVLLAGASVAVAGPIAFIGVMVPHIARYFTGNDHRWLLPYCVVLGACLLLAADIGARWIAMPNELPVGVVTAIVGVPFFVWIARQNKYES